MDNQVYAILFFFHLVKIYKKKKIKTSNLHILDIYFKLDHNVNKIIMKTAVTHWIIQWHSLVSLITGVYHNFQPFSAISWLPNCLGLKSQDSYYELTSEINSMYVSAVGINNNFNHFIYAHLFLIWLIWIPDNVLFINSPWWFILCGLECKM